MHGVSHSPAAAKLFLHALEDEDVGVHGHADSDHETGDTGSCERDWQPLEDRKHEHGVDGQGTGRHEARQAVPDDEEQADDDESHDAGEDAAVNSFLAKVGPMVCSEMSVIGIGRAP